MTCQSVLQLAQQVAGRCAVMTNNAACFFALDLVY